MTIVDVFGDTDNLLMMKSRAENSRLFLSDPVCVLPYGHNVAAMANFREFLGSGFSEVLCIGSRYLPEDIATGNDILREFDFYYNDAIPIADLAEEDIVDGHDAKIRAAKSDFLALLERHQVGGDDVLCYPSVDFYSLHAIADSIEELKKRGSPTLMLRLIGVMETASSGAYAKPLDVTLALLGRIQQSGLSVKFAAETPRYADFLALHIDAPVSVAANIETREQLPLPTDGPFTVVCPGSARFDKGFLDLAEIFAAVREVDREMKIRFRTQNLPDRDIKNYVDYARRLYAIPGVEILPSQISSEEIAAMYANADMVLLPYAKDVYELRGSAVMIEAICSGRLTLALDGPAFVDQLRYFGAGEVSPNLADMPQKIIEMSRQSPQLRFARARQARDRFTRDLSDSYRNWMER